LLSLLSWGKRYLLKVIEADAAPEVALKHSQILLKIRPATSDTKKEAILAQWYRDQLKQAVLPLIVEWEPLIGVEVRRFFVQRMKTNWGSCNTEMGNIRLNTDLAKKPGE